MHNFRKVKKKKKTRPIIAEESSPQQILIEISNSQEEELKAVDVDSFMKVLDSSAKRETSKGKSVSRVEDTKNTIKFLEGVRLKRKRSVELTESTYRSNLDKEYCASLRSKSVRLVYL